MTRSQPLIITAALTGGGPRKGPAHPVTPGAVVADAATAWRAGAAIIHIHARTADGGTTMAPAAYRAMVEAIRADGCDALIDLSAGDDSGKADHAARLAVVKGGGDLVTLAGVRKSFGENVVREPVRDPHRHGGVAARDAVVLGLVVREPYRAGRVTRLGGLAVAFILKNDSRRDRDLAGERDAGEFRLAGQHGASGERRTVLVLCGN